MKSKKQIRRPRNKSKKFRRKLMKGGGKLEDDLFDAVINMNYEAVLDLLNNGADVNARNVNGRYNTEWTPLLFACFQSGPPEIAILLIDKGADINVKNIRGHTPLYIAILNNRHTISAYLINKGADIYIKSNSGNTYLHSAAAAGNDELVNYFIERGLDINAIGFSGETALHTAIQNKETWSESVLAFDLDV